MPFDGNGNWTSNFNAEADRDAGYKILASRFDNILLADIAQSFENCLTKDTQIKPQTNFNANNYRIINLANPEDDNDALTYGKFRTGNNTLTGNNTWTGNNTFSGNIVSTGGLDKIVDATLGTTPSSLKSCYYGVNDRNGTWLGGWETHYTTDGYIYKQISQRKQDGSESFAVFQIGYDSNQNEFTNASNGVKSSMVNWGMPNYTAAVSKTKDVAYIADSNGYLIGCDQYQGTSGSYNAYVYINGVNVRLNPTQDNYSINTWCYPISKGSSYSYSGSANMEMFFVPAIGG